MPRTQRSRNAVPASIHGPRIGFLLCVLALVLIGFVMVYSAGSISNINNGVDALKSLTDQVMYAVFGALIAFAIYRFVPVSIWRTKWLWAALALLVVVILLTALVGVDNYGAKRWLRLGPVTIQVSEFAKIVFVLVSARIYTDFVSGEISGRRCALGFTLLVLVPLALIYKTQSDLGTTMICIVAVLAVLWYGELPIGFIAIILAVIVVFGLIAMFGTAIALTAGPSSILGTTVRAATAAATTSCTRILRFPKAASSASASVTGMRSTSISSQATATSCLRSSAKSSAWSAALPSSLSFWAFSTPVRLLPDRLAMISP